MRIQPELDDIAAEFEGTELGDTRLDERLKRIAALAGVAPADSFPDQMSTVADREALYRFLSNPKVTMDRVLGGHVQQTHARLQSRDVIRVVHDTTTFHFRGDREGLGKTRGGASGFLGHMALAVAADELREPLGVLGLHAFIHRDAVAHRGMTASQRVTASRAKRREERESSRWEALATEVSAALPEDVRAIHVMDQEANDYDLLAELQQKNLGFVVRGSPNRRTVDGRTVKKLLAKRKTRIFRSVPINRRTTRKEVSSRGRHPAREERQATLNVRWGRVTIPRRQYSQSGARELSFWAVHVFEPKPPAGEEPVEWMLFTSEPVTDLNEATTIVDHYRARWVIEEYFKALKTGCAFEKRQLTTFDALTRALAVFVPIAWRLLVLRHLARSSEPLPAHRALEPEQILLLRRLLEKRRYSLPPEPSVRDAFLGIAALGGHIKNNGDPGWMVLGRGFTRFVEAEEVWHLAREM